MFIIVGIMLTGVLVGYLFRSKKLSWIQSLITLFIWILLFLLGVDVGENQTIINNLHTLGVEALCISVASVIGSASFALILWRKANKKNKEGEEV